MSLGTAIKNLRQQYQLSQPELAVKVGIEQSYLSKIENDKSTPSQDIFERLLSAFNLTLEQFMAQWGEDIDLGQLNQITQTKQYLQQQQSAIQRRRAQIQIWAIALVALGCALFYCAHNALLFPERQIVYESQGVIKDSEPDDVFSRWRHLIPDEQDHVEVDKKRKEMSLRADKTYRYSFDMLGIKFEEQVDGGRRVFFHSTVIEHPRTINGVLTFIAVFAFVSGVMLTITSILNGRRKKR
ncbi:helix-turn-helix domain-containing protein [Pseudoalteromonas sp. T1lg10]|uniref:helix-turn-helix domain-containing protein n=1 Tax=Pseudoalteromonas sp. T1lg10 TaxID=2077093 RepID=UPI000CF7021F|nr:helix-turn-helix transcriptional regulator [Pseudoalteromonas sp. T1lg10]